MPSWQLSSDRSQRRAETFNDLWTGPFPGRGATYFGPFLG
jgi:hypothetical protein